MNVRYLTICHRSDTPHLQTMLSLLLVLPLTIFAQDVNDDKRGSIQEANAQDRLEFYKILIPAAINGSEIAPAALSSFNADFGDDEITFKYGNTFKKPADEGSAVNDDLNNSYFLSLGFTAADGITTLYKYDNPALELTFKTGVTFLIKQNHWYFTNPPELIGKRSTTRFLWVNIIPKVTFANLNVFSGDTTYKEKESTTYSIMASLNGYFHSKMNLIRLMNSIYSLSVGFGRINNYSVLPEVTLRKGILYTALPYTYYVTKEEEVKGRLGTFEEREAFLYSVEAYKVIRQTNLFSCYLGGRYFGYAAAQSVSNASVGLFFSFSDDKKEEKFGFAINGVASNIQEINDDEADVSLRENLLVTLSASVPLKFKYAKGR